MRSIKILDRKLIPMKKPYDLLTRPLNPETRRNEKYFI